MVTTLGDELIGLGNSSESDGDEETKEREGNLPGFADEHIAHKTGGSESSEI